MLALPDTGLSRSIEKHNCDLHLFCDWVEGSLLFKAETRISRTDIVDVLCEEEFYDDQAFASDWLDDVWGELQRRQRILGSTAPFKIEPRAIKRTRQWQKVPAYSFCVLMPLLQSSSKWFPNYTVAQRTKHHAQQGLLFERISEESLRSAGWLTHLTGWSSTTAVSLPGVAAGVARKLGEPEHSGWERNVSPNANEAGLDLVLFRTFADGRCGFPVYLAQCASGKNWDTKLHTPVLSVWSKIVDFAAPPQKAFVLPHSLGMDDLRQVTVKVQGVVFDRYRLHDTSRPRKWWSPKLASDIETFLKPLIKALPSYV